MNKPNTIIENMEANDLRMAFNEITEWKETGQIEENSLIAEIHTQRILKREVAIGSKTIEETISALMYETMKRYMQMMFV